MQSIQNPHAHAFIPRNYHSRSPNVLTRHIFNLDWSFLRVWGAETKFGVHFGSILMPKYSKTHSDLPQIRFCKRPTQPLSPILSIKVWVTECSDPQQILPSVPLTNGTLLSPTGRVSHIGGERTLTKTNLVQNCDWPNLMLCEKSTLLASHGLHHSPPQPLPIKCVFVFNTLPWPCEWEWFQCLYFFSVTIATADLGNYCIHLGII